MADFQLNFDDRSVLDALDRMYKSLDRIDGKVDGLQDRLNKGFSLSGGASKKLNDSLASSAKSAVDADKAISKFGTSAGLSFAKFNVFAGIVEGAAQSVAGFAGNVVRLGAGLESVEKNFAIYLKSNEKAKALISELNKLSADTPFTQNQIFSSAEQLVSFGFAADEVTDTLRRLGDISGGSEEKLNRLIVALSQVKAKGKLTGDELAQFQEAGLSSEILAQGLGLTTAKFTELISQSKISFEDLRKGIKAATDEGGFFFGVLESQSQSLTGLFSTLTGNFEQLQGGLGKQLLPFLKNVVIEANNIISSIDPAAIGEAFTKAGDAAAPFLNAIRDGFGENVLPALIRFRDTIQELADKFADYFNGINSQGAVVEFLKKTIEGVTVAFAALVDAVSFSIDAITDFAAPIYKALAPAVNTIIRVLTAVIDKIIEFKGEAKTTGDGFTNLGKVVAFFASGISTLVEVIGEVVNGIFNLGESSRSQSPIIRAFGDVANFLAEPWRFFAQVLGVVQEKILEFTGFLESESEKQARIQAENLKKQQDAQAAAEDAFRSREREGDTFKTDAQIKKELEQQKKADQQKLQAQRAAAKQRAEEAKKEADKAFKLETERQKLKISLIEDETEKAIAAEKLRSREQLKEIDDLFKGTKDYNALIEQERERHRDNVAKIIDDMLQKQDEADEKVRKRNQDILKQERQFQEDRQNAQLDLTDARAQQEEALYNKQQELLDSATALYLLKLRQRGASEVEIEKEATRLSLIAAASRIERKRKLLEQELLDLKDGNEQRRKEIVLEIAALNNDAEAINIQLNIEDKKAKRTLADFFTDFKGSLADALKIDPGVLDGLLSDAKAGLGSFFDSIKTLSDLQIEQNNRVIESLNERIDKTKEALEKEQADKEKGYANDVSTQQAALDALLAQRQAAEQKNRELQAKQVRFQLLQDTAQQVSGIATSVVNIIKGTSGIPFVGIALAAVQVAALFALLASARSQARAATRLYKGGRIPVGKTDENGQTGYMIEDTGVMVGGDEWVINRKTSDEHNKFLHKLNAGKYKGVDLETLADTAQRRSMTRQTILNEIVEHVLTHVNRQERNHSQLSSKTLQLDSAAAKAVLQRQFELQKIDFSQAIDWQVARVNRAAQVISINNTTINNNATEKRGKGDGITLKDVEKLLEKHTNRLLRSGFLPLQQLGNHTVGPDGTETHYQIDPMLNTRTTVKKKK